MNMFQFSSDDVWNVLDTIGAWAVDFTDRLFPDAWQQGAAESGSGPPSSTAPDGFSPCGPWEPHGTLAPSYNVGPCKISWRRPLKRITDGGDNGR